MRCVRFIVCLTTVVVYSVPAWAQDAGVVPTARPLSWESPLLGKSISCTVRLPVSDAEKKPAVVYLKNLPAARLCTLDDKTLIEGFLAQGLMVIEADYQGDARAVAPDLLPEIDRWYGYLFSTSPFKVTNFQANRT